MAKAILLPAIITSMLTGITEPIEFTFLFVSPLLWVIHATLTAASQAILRHIHRTSLGSIGPDRVSDL